MRLLDEILDWRHCTYIMNLPFLLVHHIIVQYDLSVKSVFEFLVVYLNKSNCLHIIYMNTEDVTGFTLGITKYELH